MIYLFRAIVTLDLREVLTTNKNNPNITIVPPNHCDHVTCSPKIKYARMVAPIGSKTIPIDIVEVLNHLKAQLNKEWPKKVGNTARARKIHQWLAGYPKKGFCKMKL